jgi:hypothetical protein
MQDTTERTIIISAVWMAALAFACSLALADPDLWGHTLYGLRSIDAGLLTESVDPFSYTAFGEPWVNHEWLTEYQFGFLWRTTGSVGLWWWRNLLVLVVFVVALLEFRRTHASVPAVVVLIVFNALCLSNFVVFIRPQLATFALFAVTLAILRRHWDGLARRAIWCLPLLMLLWANLHGGFLAGLGLIGLCWGGTGIMAARDASQRPQFMVLSGVLAASVCCITWAQRSSFANGSRCGASTSHSHFTCHSSSCCCHFRGRVGGNGSTWPFLWRLVFKR